MNSTSYGEFIPAEVEWEKAKFAATEAKCIVCNRELQAMLGNVSLFIQSLQDNKPEPITKAEKITKHGRKSQKYYERKSSLNARLVRDATLSMKVENTTPICKIDIGGKDIDKRSLDKKDLTHFINKFFPNKTQVPYSRLKPISKLLICQFALHNDPDINLTPFPFVFRLSPELRQLEDSYLKKKIQRKLQSRLQRNPLYWVTKENDGGLDKTITHINGEILLFQGELEKCRQSFKELFGLHELDVSGTTKAKTMLNHAIRFPMTSRLKEAAKHGEFYTVYNWVGYSIKQERDRNIERFKNQFRRKPQPNKENFHFISRELNKLAIQFYDGIAKKNK
jgi:hypothetical protein